MIGALIVSHGRLGEGFLNALSIIFGSKHCIEELSISLEKDLDYQRDTLLKTIDKLDTGKGVIIFTDLFGGTPSNLALSISSKRNVEVIAGVNLPMLIKFVQIRKHTLLAEASHEIMQEGKKYIYKASDVFAA